MAEPIVSVGITTWLSLCLYSRFCGYSYLCIIFIMYGALCLYALRCLSLLLPGQTGSSISKSSSMLGNSLVGIGIFVDWIILVYS